MSTKDSDKEVRIVRTKKEAILTSVIETPNMEIYGASGRDCLANAILALLGHNVILSFTKLRSTSDYTKWILITKPQTDSKTEDLARVINEAYLELTKNKE